MATSRTPTPADQAETYSKMSVGDVEAIGAHCQMPFCHQLDFLPFRCESCRGKFCLDHRTETAHSCSHAGEWARRQNEANRWPTSAIPTRPKPNILSHEQQCAALSCKTLINTPLVTGVHCEKCRRSYCLKHRFMNDHDCAKLTPLGSGPNGAFTQREKGLAALEKLKAWGATKRAAATASSNSIFPQSKAKSSAAASLAATATLKKTAKGDDKIPQDKRVYLHVEASSDTLTAKIPKGNFFYSSEWSVGRMLDLAAKSLQVSNVNNRSESEEDKLRVFHIEGGRLLEFSEKLGQSLKTGNTIVLLRGVRAALPATPSNSA